MRKNLIYILTIIALTTALGTPVTHANTTPTTDANLTADKTLLADATPTTEATHTADTTILTDVNLTAETILLADTTPTNENTDTDYFIPIIPKPQTLPGPEGGGARETLVQNILPNLAVGITGFASMAALLFLIIGGVRFVTAYGNEERVESAKKQVIFSLVGLLISLLAYTIVTVIIRINLA